MKKTDVAREYRVKFGMEMPTLKLARIMYDENNLLFQNVENARTHLRALEGKAGPRFKVGDKSMFTDVSRPKNPYNLPETYQDTREPLILPLICNNILLISDLHIPYHDINAITIALDYGVANNVNTIFINGDLLDFHGLSRFEHDPRKRRVKDEFDAAKSFLVTLRKTFPNALIYWLKGNHCTRYEKWLMSKVHEVFDDEYFVNHFV